MLYQLFSMPYTAFLLWIGFFILSKQKYSWFLHLFNFLLTGILAYFGFLLIGSWIRPVLFVVVVLLTTLARPGWKQHFYYLAISSITIMFVTTWTNFVAKWITIHVEGVPDPIRTSILVFATNIVAILLLFFLLDRRFKRTKTSECIKRIDTSYQGILFKTTVAVLVCYYAVYILPAFFLRGPLDLVLVRLLYVLILTIFVFMTVFLFQSVIKKEIALDGAQKSLDRTNMKLVNVQDRVVDQYQLITDLEEVVREKANDIKVLDNYFTQVGNFEMAKRRFDHNNANVLIVLEGAFQFGDQKVFDQIYEEYKLYIKELEELKPKLPDFKNLKAPEFAGIKRLMLVKADEAISKSIEFTTEIPAEVNQIGIPILDLGNTLGVWLDNAIEEAVHTVKKWIHVSFILETDLEGLSTLEIRVSNSCRLSLPIEMNNLDVQGVSSKGNDRGSGLPSVKEMMLKHEHVHVVTIKDEDVFTQLLEIELD